MTTGRWGLTLPLGTFPLPAHRELVQEAERLGYTDAWSQDTDVSDPFLPLALTAAWTERMRLGTAIVNVYTHGPGEIATMTLELAEMAPGRFVLGLGSSSPVIVESWNGIPFEKPYSRTRDVFALVRAALTGERVAQSLPTLSVNGYRLPRPLPAPVPMHLAALRGRMLRLAGQVADGVIINWLGAEDVPRVLAEVRAGAEAAGRDPNSIEVVARILVVLTDDPEPAYVAARRGVTGYLNTPVYRAFHQWLGNDALYGPMWERWEANDRRGALAAIPDAGVARIIGIGDADTCRRHVQAYVDAGVTTPVLAFAGAPSAADAGDVQAAVQAAADALRALAP